jgi:hypothetical protein
MDSMSEEAPAYYVHGFVDIRFVHFRNSLTGAVVAGLPGDGAEFDAEDLRKLGARLLWASVELDRRNIGRSGGKA